jgi:CheY-like chemotaxis protein
MMQDPVPSRRVLIAEDVDTLAGMMQALLREKGFTVEAVGDGEACLQRIPVFKPDLVILDIMMPKVHGIEIIRVLKAYRKTQDIGVIVCSAKDYKTDRDRIRELGVERFINKPFKPQDFVDAVSDYFAAGSAAAPAASAPIARGAVYAPELGQVRHRVKLWGTRGSTPVSNPRFVRHGGNTPCLSVVCGDELVVIDAGTGIRELGQWLLTSSIRRVHLFIGHTHWDHIQGFPFFGPAFHPAFELFIYGAAGFGKNLKSVFQGQLDQDYFPVQLEDMRSAMTFSVLRDNPVRIGDLEVHWDFVNHPGAAVGFKLVAGGRSMAYITDNEFLEGYVGAPADLNRNHPAVIPYRPFVDFVSGCDLLVHEAQYLPGDYPGKVAWGHSSVSNVCALAKLAEVKRWVVTHHDPAYDDEALGQKLLLTEQILAEIGWPVPVANAYDGMEILL